ncbi:hypothetical protein AB833_15715 [Chromatiales bacterium (ex Bugula neritina AB1)]|nr:hypothetical protein AB833_15715 [Chromatiales bacterium (ex Bugula neritina AB1)]
MSDQETIRVYDNKIDDYLGMVDDHGPDAVLSSFMSKVTPGGFVLDLGCGPAHSSSVMRANGFLVDPVDASEGMVKIANEKFDINARVAVFEDINSTAEYDGIWANFSLLHAAADDLPDIIKALHKAMKAGGVFHLGMKIGSGASRDKFGRLYTYYSQQQLCDYLLAAGFTIDEIETTEGTGLAGELESWISICSIA